MLVLGTRLKESPVMSLQTGTRLAVTSTPLINPANLKIVAFELEGPLLTEKPSFLRVADIRELSGVGMIIDSSDELLALDDVIKIKELHELGFTLVGMNVIDEHKRKLGKVDNYTVETNSFVIEQLNVKHGIFRGITDTGLLIHRSQITEINDNAIIVKSTAKKISVAPVMESVRNEYVNPFRRPSPQPEQADTRR
ncbi:PRC-barrel domain-containing protein [Candidatus Saccharibacteria bacterium]|nr:PRC-barrel domain-containing protein [Candidatus Saccharibacteria bacterium]